MVTITKTNLGVELIPLADAKTQCRIDDSDPEIVAIGAELTNIIADAIDIASSDINADVAYTDVTYTISDFIGSSYTIREGNLNSITSVKVNSSDVTNYTYEAHHSNFTITLDTTYSGTLEVKFKTGYNSASNLPGRLRRALLVKIHDLYDNERGSYLPGVLASQKTYQALISSFNRNYY